MLKIDHFTNIVKNCDFQEIEFARDDVTKDDLPALALLYNTLNTWEQKTGLIHLVQDYQDDILHNIMFDFLKAPKDKSGDAMEVMKVISLCYLEKDFDKFMVYYKNRELIEKTAKRYLEEFEKK